MKKILISLSFCMIVVLLKSQSTFDRHYFLADYISGVVSIVPDNEEDRIYCIGIGTDNAPYDHYALLFAAIDLDGNLLYKTLFKNAKLRLYPFHYSNNVIIVGDHILFSTSYNHMGYLYQFDKYTGEINEIINITNPGSDFDGEFGHQLIQINQHLFASLESIYYFNDPNNQSQLTIIDLEKNENKYTLISIPDYNSYFHELYPVESGIVIGGSINSVHESSDNFQQSAIQKIDYEGNLQWVHYSIQDDIRILLRDLYAEEDESVIYLDHKGLEVEYFGFTDLYWRPYITKLNKHHQVEWETALGPEFYNYSTMARVLPSLEGDGYIVAGEMYNYDFNDSISNEGYLLNGEPVQSHAYIAKISNQGDILWQRTYNPNNLPGSKSYIYSLNYTPDGGYIMVGSKKNRLLLDSFSLSASWLIKVDADGCLVPGCQDSLQIKSPPKNKEAHNLAINHERWRDKHRIWNENFTNKHHFLHARNELQHLADRYDNLGHSYKKKNNGIVIPDK